MSETAIAAPGSSLYPWQESIWRELLTYVETQRIPHALLIQGPEGIGKLHLALSFANYLLCTGAKSTEHRCGRCDACRWLDAGTHPDLIRVEPPDAGKAIPIDKIRELTEALALSAQYGRYRIVIIRPADRLNSAAANALLKTLEEPGQGTVIMLLAARPGNLPATIKSRCQRLEVPLPDRRLALSWLRQEGLNGNPQALLAISGGAPLKARDLGESGCLEQRDAVFASWREIAANQVDPVIIAETLTALALPEVLRWISSWTIDMIRLGLVPTAPYLANPDLRPALQAEAQKLDLKELFRFYERLIRSTARIDSPLNVQLLLESILIEWYSLMRNP
ncbi:MAG: DNA polymerase III subunit delta' [Gammaproteobacteria bacterium]